MQLDRHFLLIIMANIRGIPLTNRVPTSLPGTWGIKLFSYKKPWKHSDTRPTYPLVGNSERSATEQRANGYLLFLSLDCPGMASAVVGTHNYCGKQRGSCPLCR